MMRLTDAQIEAAKSPRGGFTRKTLAAWGVPWPPPKGWRKALIEGRSIPERRRRRSRSNGRQAAKRPLGNFSGESLVFAVAAFLIERGHYEAAEDLADNWQTAVAYMVGAGVANPGNSHTSECYRAS